ncbi:MAG TPA: DUF6491 family protein [Woeseiaceae bacterium]|nr:DUF6491 family protein [Woeseiaceae bacterium]
MRHLLTLLISGALVACAAAPDPTAADYEEPEPRGSDCIFEGSIRDYRVLDDSNLVVTTTRKQKYHMRLSYSAFGLRSAWAVGFASRTGQVCPGDELIVSNGFDPDAVRIYSIRAIDPQEYENLLVRHGEKVPEKVETPPDADIAGAEVEELD